MKSRYTEVVVSGHAHGAISYLRGFLEGRGLDPGRLFDAESEGFACEPLRERIRDLVDPAHATLHLLVPADLLAPVREAIDQGAQRGEPMVLKDTRPIASARFSFEFAAFSRADGERLQALLASPGAGLKLDPGSGVEISLEPTATGTEGYAPLHEYEAHGKGTVTGEVPAVIQFYRRAGQEELITLKRIVLLER